MSAAPTYPARTGESRQDFLNVFPLIVDELLTYMKKEGMPRDAVKWYEDVSLTSCYQPCSRFYDHDSIELITTDVGVGRSSTTTPPVGSSTEACPWSIPSRSFELES